MKTRNAKRDELIKTFAADYSGAAQEDRRRLSPRATTSGVAMMDLVNSRLVTCKACYSLLRALT